MATLYTIGHSTRSWEELRAALQAHGIRHLVDIRAYPGSRRLPHFNREPLARELAAAGIDYTWMPALGGRRRRILEASPHLALRNPSFRNYADYMLTDEFREAAQRLVELGERSPAAYMCAERMYFQCHRMLLSDYLLSQGHPVLHIDGTGPEKPHRLTAEARSQGGQLIYRGDRLL